MKKILLLGISLFVCSQTITAQTYKVDKDHTRVGFSATHFGISQVEGNFRTLDATLVSAKSDFSDAVFTFTAQVSSIDTNVEARDNDLKSDNYFDAANILN